MAQYKTGTVDVTNGSNIILGNGTEWLANVATNDLFTVVDSGTSYQVLSINSDTELLINGVYGGDTDTTITYTINRDFTSYLQLPLLAKGDIESSTIVSRAFQLIDDNESAGDTLEGLDDTTIISPIYGDIITYNSAAQKWENTQPITAAVDDLTDTNVPSPSVNDVLMWDGLEWIGSSALPGTGTVTNVDTGDGLSGGPITTTGLIDLDFSLPTVTAQNGDLVIIKDFTDGTVKVVDLVDLIGGAGAVTDGSNVGVGGVSVYEAKVGDVLTFRSIAGDGSTTSVALDAGNSEVEITVIPSGVNHDALLNFLPNEHIDHTTVSVLAGDGMTGGGNISVNRTLTLDINGQTADASPDFATDYVITYDADSGGNQFKKVLLQDLPGSTTFPLLAPDGSLAAPSYSFSNSSNTGMFLTGLGDLAFGRNGATILVASATSTLFWESVQVISANSITSPDFSFNNDTNTGMYQIAAGEIGFTTNGNLRLAIADAAALAVDGGGVDTGYAALVTSENDIPNKKYVDDGAGESNTTSNSGAGEGLALAKVGVDLPFRTLVGGAYTALTSDATTITIDVDPDDGSF